MVTYPCAKINLGLNIVSKRDDGYHNLETVFYPIPLCDVLEIHTKHDHFPSDNVCDLKMTGTTIEGDEQSNLVVKAYKLLAKDYRLPRIHVHLHKHIPTQAGLGGGSSDAAFMIRLLNEHYQLNIDPIQMERYAAKLGADCPFFIKAEPAFATGIGEVLTPVDTLKEHLCGCYIVVVKPPVAVSTREAFALITPRKPEKCCHDIVRNPIETWREELCNDFEPSVFAKHPELNDIKARLYNLGALYAQMSGSGSALYGIFRHKPDKTETFFPDCFVEMMKL